MMLHGLETLARDHHPDLLGHRLPSLMGGEFSIQPNPLRIERAITLGQSLLLFFIQPLYPSRFADRLEQSAQFRAFRFPLERRRQLGGQGKSGSPDDVTDVHEIIQFESKFRPALVLHRLRKFEYANVIFPDLSVHRPTRFALVPVNGGSDGKIGRILLMIGPRVDQLDRLALPLLSDLLGKDPDIAQSKVPVACPTRSVSFHRLVGERLDPDRPDAGQGNLGLDHPAVIPRVLARDQKRTVLLRDESGAVEGLGLGISENRPDRERIRTFGRIQKPLFKTPGQLVPLKTVAVLNQRPLCFLPLRKRFLMPGRTIGNVDLTTNGLPESGNEVVIFLGGQGIEFMIVATGAADGQPKKSHARGVRHVIHFIIPGRLEFLLRQLGRENASPQKTRGAQGQRIVRRNFVSRHLPTNELIERHVPVECLDHEIPVMVSMRTVVVLFKPVTLGKTGHVQPMPRPALAEAGGLEQLVDHLVKGSVLLLHHVGQADQIKMSPPTESAWVRFGIRGKPGLLQLRKDKAVDGISDPVLVFHLGGMESFSSAHAQCLDRSFSSSADAR